ncbi:MAG: PAS domain-containing protein [Fimbriimonadaceae bacterium]|nr:PAS domain-containing protein [Fimbriimonadaceae bacterium]
MPSPQTVAAILGATAGLAVALAVYALWRRETPGNWPFGALMLAVGWWSATTGAEWLAATAGAKIAWSQAAYLGITTTPVWYLLFALEYCGLRRPASRTALAGLWAVPALVLLGALTNRFHGLVWTAFEPLGPLPGDPLRYCHGPLVWLHMAYSYVLVLLASYLLLRTAYRAPRIYRGQVALLLPAAIAPLVGSVTYLCGESPLPGLDLTPLGFTVTGVLLTIAVVRYNMLNLAPIAHDALFEQMRDAVLVVDPAGRLVELNPAAAALLSLTTACCGRPVSHLLDQHAELLDLVTASGPRRAVLATELERAGSYEVSVEDLQNRQGRPAGRLVVLRDVTGAQRAQEARLELERQVQETRRLEGLVVLSAGLAHDYNNLLTAIWGNAEMGLLETAQQPQVQQLLRDIVSATERASHLTQQLRAFVGHGRGQTVPVDVSELIHQISDELGGGSRPDGLRLNLGPDLPLVVGDPGQLRLVLVAILTNALEALPPTEGLVTVTARPRLLDAATPAGAPGLPDLMPGSYVELEIADNGCGIAPVNLPKVYDPFFTTHFLGRGLGLPAALGVVRTHHGGLQIRSAVGVGTVVTLRLPATD